MSRYINEINGEEMVWNWGHQESGAIIQTLEVKRNIKEALTHQVEGNNKWCGNAELTW
jgi:hypothetical protein